jgi:predicted amidophosphoribosyltransferase
MLQQLIEVLFPPQCGGCGAIGSGACDRCLPRENLATFRLPTLHVVALGSYQGALRRAILALKTGRRDVAAAFALRLREIVPPQTVLVPIPTTPARRRERGFDGCELIAHRIAESSGISMFAQLAQVKGDRQRGRHRDERLAARGRFAWLGGTLHGICVTLLDDVVTTGATLEDCATVLRSRGALVRDAIVVARA